MEVTYHVSGLNAKTRKLNAMSMSRVYIKIIGKPVQFLVSKQGRWIGAFKLVLLMSRFISLIFWEPGVEKDGLEAGKYIHLTHHGTYHADRARNCKAVRFHYRKKLQRFLYFKDLVRPTQH